VPTARLTIEYDGTDFRGWARQPGLRTVQASVEEALCTLLRRESVEVTVAGRTDSGVHALEQVASYEGEPAAVTGLNALLPDDVAALECVAAPDGWSARFDATSRAYTYLLFTRPARTALQRGRALHWPHPLDPAVLNECSFSLVGTHDFTAFTPTETDHVRFTRDVYAAYWRGSPDGERVEFWIEADTFMRHMNRVLVGTMLEVASGKRTVADFVSLLDGAPRSAAGPTAPAHGLYLAGVGYGNNRVLG
jgi:tRNA pseudouridine38-40 synthase